MGIEDCRKGIDEYAGRLIRHKARQLVKHPGFTGADREDIEQELALELLRRQQEYDPDRAPRAAFVTGVLRQKAAMMRRARSAQKRRGGNGMCSLHEQVRNEDGQHVELADTLGQEDRLRRTGGQAKSPTASCDLRLDMETVLARLPGRLRELCNLLKTKSVAEVCRATGTPRMTLCRNIKRLRAAFEEAGLAKNILVQVETRLRN